MTRLLTVLAAGLVVVALAACNDEADPVPAEPLVVTITASSTSVSADAPVELTIAIENTGDTPLEWGQGSSSCRLFANVTLAGEAFTIPPFEICTADMVTYTLDPGATDSQTKTWDGTIGREGEVEALPAGTYELHGVGGKVTSEPLTIEVVK